MKILIAPDSFKDALDSFGVCSAIKRGLNLAGSNFEITTFPIADGGEGTGDILAHHLGGRKISLKVNDPLLRPIQTEFLITEDGHTAFIEMAKSSGLQLLKPEERNPMLTSTYGLGEMIKSAIMQGVKNIVLAIGGSATNDGGIGMASAMGYQFYDINGNLLKGVGGDLTHIHSITAGSKLIQSIKRIKISVICDVKNPLYGPNGAAYVYGKQKGADDNMSQMLDAGLQNLSLKSNNAHLSSIEGAGAAGGLGFGAMAFLDAKLYRGIDLIMDLTGFEQKVKNCDIIITGEGKIDGQTSQGKLISGITSIASKYNVPVIALCGSLDANPRDIQKLGLMAVFSIAQKPCTLSSALRDTAKNLEITSFNIGNWLNRQ